jgi:RNA polymerase sigma factor (sigma-70 family)
MAKETDSLVRRARNGDRQAWDAMVERFAPLIWSICRGHQLNRADAEDVGQSVWLQLVTHLDTIRDPAALPGWLATTTRRECRRVVGIVRGPRVARRLEDVEGIADDRMVEPELLAAERHMVLREVFADLPRSYRQLMSMLIEDPPVPYAEISARLGIPQGSIGPTRRRCLEKFRQHPAFVALISDQAEVHVAQVA